MDKPKFVYVIFIRTTAEKLWDALTKPEFTRAYWFGCWQDTTWEPGSSWRLMIPDGRVGDSGEVVEVDKPRRLVLRWRNEFRPELRVEGYSGCTFDIEAAGDDVFVGHDGLMGAMHGDKVTVAIKGDALEVTKIWPKGM